MNRAVFLSRKLIIAVLLPFSYVCKAQVQDNININVSQPDSIMTTFLKEVSVSARKNLYEIRPDVIIYDVNSDSSLMKKTSYEALRNVPLLNVQRNGTVRSVGNWPIEYLVNGLHDQAVSNNIYDALESLDAKYLKRIEARITRNQEGQEILQINIVTKGRLWGYRGLAHSSLTDESWRNGAYLFAKKHNLGISISYYNTWQWDHKSTQESEEWRYASEDLFHTKSKHEESGYKTDIHDFELNMSYEITPLKVFSAFGRAMLKTNPHRKTINERAAESNALFQTYKYRQEGLWKMDDAEYYASLDYEQLFGEDAERGKFYIGYNLYSRPTKEKDTMSYTLLEFLAPGYVKDLYDYKQETTESGKRHTLTALYRRNFNHHQFYAEEYMRYRNESEDVLQTENYKSPEHPQEIVKRDSYTHRQFMNGIKIGYGYTNRKIEAKAGTFYQFLHDTSKMPLLNNSFSSNQHLITPYSDFSYTPTSKVRLSFSYSMGKQVPSINALNPYIYTNVANELSYGNPNLNPQSTQQVYFSANIRVGKFNLYASSTHSFARDIILRHSFLKGDILNTIYNNIGKRYENLTKVSASSKITRSTWVQMDANLYYTDYTKTEIYKRNRGCTFSANAYIEQELPHNFDIYAGGGYNSPYIYMQGKGEENFYYNLSIERNFPKRRISISADAKSFLPIYYKSTHTYNSPDYYNTTYNRSFHASFELSFTWRFGKLKAEQYSVDEQYKNEDIKTNYDK